VLDGSYLQCIVISEGYLHIEGVLSLPPAPNVKIKLDELNKILDEMEQGEQAVKKLAEMDASMGMQDPIQVAKRMRGDKDAKVNTTPPKGVQSTGDTLGDATLADNLRQQAERMSREAKGLMAEVDRLLKEAASLDPVKAVKETAPKAKKVTKTTKTKVTA